MLALRSLVALSLFFCALVMVSGAVGRGVGAPVVAFSADYDLWLADPTFGAFRRLTHNGGRSEEDQPTWSPDGARLVFMTVRRQPFNARLPNSDLALLDLSDGSVRLLRSMPPWEDAPAWSPDGASIAFSEKGTGAGGTSVYVMPIDAPAQARVVYTSPRRNDVSAVWTPDGHALLVHGDSANPGGVVIVRVDVNTGATETVLARTAYRPRPSPDGQAIALWIPAFEGYSLAVWRVGMDSPQPLSQSYPNPLPFAWLPDGRLSLAVRGEVGNSASILQIDPVTGAQSVLFTFPSRVSSLAWRP